jgi:hypothetical protein
MKSDIRRDPDSRQWFGTFEYEPGTDPVLKPCPFCGEAEDLLMSGTSSSAFYVARCGNCYAESGGHDVDLPKIRVNARARGAFEAAHREGFARGIAAWNRRAAV